MTNNTARSSGFTLLEVLLALAILAIAGMSVLQLSGESVRNTPILEQRVLAQLVADNKMTDLQLRQQWPPLNWKQADQQLAGRQWFIRFRSVETTSKDFRAIDVEVREKPDAEHSPLATLRSYMAKAG